MQAFDKLVILDGVHETLPVEVTILIVTRVVNVLQFHSTSLIIFTIPGRLDQALLDTFLDTVEIILASEGWLAAGCLPGNKRQREGGTS